MSWAQGYAAENRRVMMDSVLEVLRVQLWPFTLGALAVNCHHNYVVRESRGGEELWVTLKQMLFVRG